MSVISRPALVLLGLLVGCTGEEAIEDEPALAETASALTSTCVTIQRTASTPAAVADTFLAPGLGPQGSQPTIETAIGRFALLRFELASIPPDATVTSARLTVIHRDRNKSLFAPTTARLYRVTAPWSEATATLATVGFPIAIPSIGALPVPRTGGLLLASSTDLTAQVRAWLAGTPNHGLMITETWWQGTEYPSSEAAGGKPRLEVCYTQPLPSPCEPNPCEHGGTCTANGNEAVCACTGGWGGPTCADDANGCSPSPCFDPATCTDVPAPGTGFTCAPCPAGLTTPTGGQFGVICVTCPAGTTSNGDGICREIDGCAGVTCFGGAACTDVPAPGTGFTCPACPAGFVGDGVTCVEQNGCSPSPCFDPATCTDVPAPGTGFTCAPCPAGLTTPTGGQPGVICVTCPAGTTSNGDGICREIDGCAGVTCFGGAACTDVPAPGTGFSCPACPAGFVGDGVTCVEQNGCSPSPCFDPATCTDVPAPGTGFTCAPCPAGLTTPTGGQPGVICVTCPAGTTSNGDGICREIDGCAGVTCFGGAACTDVPAPGTGFTCPACPAGFVGDGVTCVEQNGCSPSPCFDPATCTDVPAPGTGFTCAPCPAGLTTPTGGQPGVICVTCPAGTTSNGDGICREIDGCAGVTCFGGAACTDVPAPGTGFSCPACPAGFVGDGVTCRAKTCADEPCFPGVECIDGPDGATCGECPELSIGDGVTCLFDGPWSRPFGSGRGDAVVTDVATTPVEHDVIAVGTFHGTLELGPATYTAPASGDGELFIVAYDRYGRYRWSHHYAAAVRGAELEAADGDVYVTADVTGDLDLGGGPLPAAGPGARDIALVHLDIDGNHVWSRRYGRVTAGASSLAVNAAGTIYLGFADGAQGTLLRVAPETGETLWEQPAAIARVAVDEADRLYALDETGRLSRYSPAGQLVDSVEIGVPIGASSLATSALGVGSGPEPMIWIAARYSGLVQFADGQARGGAAVGLLLRYQSLAAGIDAAFVFGGEGDEVVTRIALDPRGVASIAGYTNAPWVWPAGSYGGGEDGFTITFDAAAQFRTHSSFGGEGDQRINGLAPLGVTSDWGLGGSNSGRLSLDSGEYLAPTGTGWLARFTLSLVGT